MPIKIFNNTPPPTLEVGTQKFRLLFVVLVFNFVLYSDWLTDWAEVLCIPRVMGPPYKLHNMCPFTVILLPSSVASPFIWIIYLDARNRKNSQDTRQPAYANTTTSYTNLSVIWMRFLSSFVRFELQSHSWYMRIFYVCFFFVFCTRFLSFRHRHPRGIDGNMISLLGRVNKLYIYLWK